MRLTWYPGRGPSSNSEQRNVARLDVAYFLGLHGTLMLGHREVLTEGCSYDSDGSHDGLGSPVPIASPT